MKFKPVVLKMAILCDLNAHSIHQRRVKEIWKHTKGKQIPKEQKYYTYNEEEDYLAIDITCFIYELFLLISQWHVSAYTIVDK